MSFFGTVEFYVIAATAAAAAVVMASLPRRTGAVRQYFAAGELSDTGSTGRPQLQVWVDDSRRVQLRRSGLPAWVGDTGAVSLAVNVKGFDVEIEERLSPGRLNLQPVDTAEFVLDFFAAERYHICYRGQDAGVFAAFSLPVREGISVCRDLQ